MHAYHVARGPRASANVALAGLLLLAAACGSAVSVGDAAITPGGDPAEVPPEPTGDLPDLVVASERLLPSIRWDTFDPDSCEVQEACVDAPGARRLLTFSTLVSNVGTADLVFGDPAGNPAYEFSPCHGHYHLRGFALYQLRDAAGSHVLTGHKQGFCVQDAEALPGTQTDPKYSGCTNQGLSVGWGDLYGADLACQWIDITDLPAGTYQLQVSANPDHLISEARLDNDLATVEVVIDPP